MVSDFIRDAVREMLQSIKVVECREIQFMGTGYWLKPERFRILWSYSRAAGIRL